MAKCIRCDIDRIRKLFEKKEAEAAAAALKKKEEPVKEEIPVTPKAAKKKKGQEIVEEIIKEDAPMIIEEPVIDVIPVEIPVDEIVNESEEI